MILFSKYSPVWYGLGKLNPGLVLGYLIYCLWSPNCWATLYYSIVPSFCLLKGIPLFPQVFFASLSSHFLNTHKAESLVYKRNLTNFAFGLNFQVSSKWFLPFAYVIIAELIYSFAEFLWSGGTILGWWNEQRIWLYKRTSSYMFAFLDTMLKLFGSSNTTFIVTPKVTNDDVLLRYKQEKMEFGSASPMLTILSTLAMINLFCLMGLMKNLILTRELGLEYVFETMALQFLLCGVLVFVNLPLYNALFFRQDKGKIPSSTAFQSVAFALSVCTCIAYM